MGTLTLVRHGQASFGADDYDRLSELGHRQSVRLGEHFRRRGLVFDAVLTGTLKRHRQTLAGIAEGLQAELVPLVWPGLDEYRPEALIATVHAAPLKKPTNADEVRHHFRLLRQGLAAWMEGRAEPEGMPCWADFLAGVTSALDHVRARHHGAQVLAVSSGGPISAAVAQVLGVPAAGCIELNLRIRNTGVSEFVFTPTRHQLLSFNGIAHLDDVPDWVTYA
ncbi:histidine phosphatase family protein [Aquabacterium sp. J223]|uniref:histidine phosphatase family protein n=1 Tax=Aquabacterium sp. J223 TaxID=2898431 RepID=UPI0021ADC79C|nr:histidine phosphatase family protein [Aquabacterium sp. J223]UUX95602.1 histidine phosphatase family protein [Aquabacterium sp. J223]